MSQPSPSSQDDLLNPALKPSRSSSHCIDDENSGVILPLVDWLTTVNTFFLSTF